MELTIENKINLVFILISVLFIAVLYVIYLKFDEYEHLNGTDGSAYVYNTGDANLGNVNVTGKITVGSTTIDGTTGKIIIGSGTNLTTFDPAGIISVGKTVLDGTNGISVGETSVVGSDGSLKAQQTFNPTTLTIGGTTIGPDGTVTMTKGNLVMGTSGTTINSTDGSISIKGGVVKLGADGSLTTTGNVNVGQNFNISAADGSLTTKANIAGAKITTTSDVVVGGALNLPNNVSFTTFEDGHFEMATKNGAVLYYGTDGTIRRYAPKASTSTTTAATVTAEIK